MQFRKKPIVIEAWCSFLSEPMPIWLCDAMRDGIVWYQGGAKPYHTIKTLEGEMRADAGDWIIRGVKGEIYPIKADIFAATYEAVE